MTRGRRQFAGGLVSVSKNFDTLLEKCKHFFEGMQASARTRFRSHTCGLGSVFSDVHAAGKHDLTLFRRLRTAELCKALAA